MIAMSHPREKELMIALLTRMLAGGEPPRSLAREQHIPGAEHDSKGDESEQ